MKIITLILFATFSLSFLNESSCQTEKIDSLWFRLAYKKGGCLTGGQYVRNGSFGGEGCVLTKLNSEWVTFFQYPKKELTDFLIIQMRDTSTTNIHTCPFYSSTNGELAVYCLQKIYNKNWFDFKEFKKYKNRETTSATDNAQGWLQQILINKEQRFILENLWTKELEK